jgi:hypothetical protein
MLEIWLFRKDKAKLCAAGNRPCCEANIAKRMLSVCPFHIAACSDAPRDRDKCDCAIATDWRAPTS